MHVLEGMGLCALADGRTVKSRVDRAVRMLSRGAQRSHEFDDAVAQVIRDTSARNVDAVRSAPDMAIRALLEFAAIGIATASRCMVIEEQPSMNSP